MEMPFDYPGSSQGDVFEDTNKKPANLHLLMTVAQARKLGVLLMGCDDPDLAGLGHNLAMDVDMMGFVETYIYHNGTREGCELLQK